MITLEKSLKHLAWSNQKIFEYFSTSPSEVFSLRCNEGEWSIGGILTHLVGSSEWYRYCLSGQKWTNLEKISDSDGVKRYSDYLRVLDEFLISESMKNDQLLQIEDESGSFETSKSLILSQAIVHAAEHKGQIASVLKQHGYFLDLDSLDLWHFEER